MMHRPDAAFALLLALGRKNKRNMPSRALTPAFASHTPEREQPGRQREPAPEDQAEALQSLGRALRREAQGGRAASSRNSDTVPSEQRNRGVQRSVHIDRLGVITIGAAATTDVTAAPSAKRCTRAPPPQAKGLGRASRHASAPPLRPAPAARPFDLVKAIAYLEEERSAAHSDRDEAFALLASAKESCAREVERLRERARSFDMELASMASAHAAALAAQTVAHEQASVNARHSEHERLLAARRARIPELRSRAALRCKQTVVQSWRRFAAEKAHMKDTDSLVCELERRETMRIQVVAEHDRALMEQVNLFHLSLHFMRTLLTIWLAPPNIFELPLR